MDFQTSVRICIEKYADFSGRAARSEMWWFFLACFIIGVILTVIEISIFSGWMAEWGLLSSIFSLATLLPSVAVTVRRLHDIDRTGWWALLILVPIIGWLILLYFNVLKGTDGHNQYGPDPLA